MVVHALGMLVALQVRLVGVAAPGVEGTVRAVEDGRLLARVLVEAPDEHRWTLSDSLGRYHLAELSPGLHRLRFEVPGRVTLELTALVPAARTVRLDVELTQKPQELAPVIVVAPDLSADTLASLKHGRPLPLSSTWALRAPGGGRDVESALMASEGAMSQGIGGGALHFEGGSSDHVLLTVDGFPLYGAKHFGSAWSALNPDAIEDITHHSAASRSEDGSRLSGSVDVRTSLLGGDSVRVRGAVTPGDVRQLMRGALLGGRGNFLLSGRHSVRNFFGDETAQSEQNGYDDWLGAMALRLGPGRLRVLLYSNTNQLAFESRSDAGTPELITPKPNSLEWEGGTAGLAWDGRAGDQDIGLSAWRADLSSSMQWLDPSRPLTIGNQFVELGLRGRATWLRAEGEVTAGISVRQLHSHYDAHVLDLPSPQTSSPALQLASDPTVVAGSVQQRWRWSNEVSLEAGLRGTWASFGWFGSEPWLAVRLRPLRGLTLSAQAGRAYQLTQSRVNEESFVTTVAGIELPVVAGAAGVPVARSDNFAARVELNPGRGWTFRLDGYARKLSNLALAGPTPAQPFTSAEPGIGRGSATGLVARASLTRGPLEIAASVGLARASRTVGAIGYTPAFQRTGFLRSAAVLYLDPTTAVSLALTAGSGQATTPLTALDWEPYDPWNGNGELSGTPVIVGSLNSYRLPGLRQLDAGFQRVWRLRRWPAGRGVTTALTVENLLNYPNAVGVLEAQPGSPAELLSAGPRVFRLELGWAF